MSVLRAYSRLSRGHSYCYWSWEHNWVAKDQTWVGSVHNKNQYPAYYSPALSFSIFPFIWAGGNGMWEFVHASPTLHLRAPTHPFLCGFSSRSYA